MLLARSEHDPNGPLELKVVEEVFQRVAPVIELVVRGKIIGTTVEHPFFVVNRQTFVPAGQLEIGETFLSHDGQQVTLEAIRDTGKVETVYNFRVANHHTYFVGGREWGFSVWVHNARYKNFDIAPYGKFKAARDHVAGHELLQHSWLRANGKAGISRLTANPSMGLDKRLPSGAINRSDIHRVD